MTAPSHATCPLCGAPADLLGRAPPAPAPTATPPTATPARPPVTAREPPALPRCERVERALAARERAAHAATAAALEELIAGGLDELGMP
jgi:hypothetical protein